jgi:hypothetical protein
MPPLLALAIAQAVQNSPMVAPENRSGRSRIVTCQIDHGPKSRCVFTPLFGDGSFQIDLDGDDPRSLMVALDGGKARVFEVFGPIKQVELRWPYRRDPTRPACWITDTKDVEPQSICAF